MITIFRKNVALVHIFFVDTAYMKYTKNELYGFAELLCKKSVINPNT